MNGYGEEKEPVSGTPEVESQDPDTVLTISVISTCEGVEIELRKDNKPVVKRTVKAKFAPFDKAMKEVSEKLGKDLLPLP